MSYSSRTTTIFLLISFAILVQTSLGADPLSYSCSNPENFTSNTPFYSNLKTLVNFLTYKTPSTGFSLASIGHTQPVYGLSLCRGDISSSDCKTCVAEATSQVLNRCSYKKGAIIWYDNCMFKYLDQDFFGHIDNTNNFSMLNLNNVSEPDAFNYKTKELLSALSQEAHVSPMRYATGEVKLGQWNVTLYGLAQCTRDLYANDCKKCLDDAISQLPNCCDGKQGGRVVGGSCNVRYEIYPFLQN